MIPQHTDLAHSYRIYQIRNAQLSCVCACQLVEAFPSAVADPDLQITKGGGGDGHPDPSDKRGAPVSKKIFLV